MADHSDSCSCDSCDDNMASPSDTIVLNKYKMAGEIASNVLKTIISKCIPGASVAELCQIGDTLINEQTSKVFVKEKKLKKGIAFPTCICVNNCVCHFSPLPSDNVVILQQEDLAKIDLAVHIDGFIAAVATTIVVGCSKTNQVHGRKADVIQAGYTACEAIIRLFRPGNTNHYVTDTITAVGADFNCKPVEGLVSHEMKKGVLEGEGLIILNPTDAMKKDYKKFSFQPWSVYAIDVFMSTSINEKCKERDTRTSVFRRTDETYSLKLKASRDTFNQIVTNYGDFAFNVRSLSDASKARVGIKECLEHHLLMTYPVLYDKDGEYVSHFKFTVVVGPNGPIRVTTPPFFKDTIKSDLKLKTSELLKLMNEPLIKKSEVAIPTESILPVKA